MPAYFRDVAPSFVSVDEPLTEIVPSANAATLVIFGSPTWGPETQQAVTFVLKDGTAVGQVPRYGWIAARVRPGPQTLIAGIPETGNVRPCELIRGNFAAGRIYVFNHQPFFQVLPDARPQRWLSLMSHLRVDQTAGQARVEEYWKDFWESCIDKVVAEHDKYEATGARLVDIGAGVTELKIPPPP
jgi:hypothetical protein